jgi:hypothetical protein
MLDQYPPRRIYKIKAVRIDGDIFPSINGKIYYEYPQSNRRECNEFAKKWAARLARDNRDLRNAIERVLSLTVIVKNG